MKPVRLHCTRCLIDFDSTERRCPSCLRMTSVVEAEETVGQEGERGGGHTVAGRHTVADEIVEHAQGRLDVHTVRSMVASVVVLLVGRFVPMPGADFRALAGPTSPFGLEAWLPPLPLVGSSVPLLATIQLVLILLGRATNPTAQRVAAAVYLGLSFLSGFSIALYAEGLDHPMSAFPGLVQDPGWGFRARSALSWTAGASIVWWLARALDGFGRVHGTLFLMLITTLGAHTFDSIIVGESIASGSEGIGTLVAWLALPIGTLAVALVTWVRPVRSWPVKLRRWPLRSSWDGLSLVALATVPSSAFASFWSTFEGDTPMPSWVTWIDAFIVAAVAARLVVFWWNAGGPDEGGRSPMAPILAGLLVAAVFGFLFVGFARAGGPEAPSHLPLQGSESFVLVLEAEDRFAPSDADAMVARLLERGAEGEIMRRSASSVTLRVWNAKTVDAVLETLAPNALSIHLAGDVLRDGPPSLAELNLRSRAHTNVDDPSIGLSAESDCDSLVRWQAVERDDARCLYRVQTLYPHDEGCALHCLSPTPILTNQDIRDARVIVDDWSDQIAVAIELHSDAARRFEEVTRSNVGHRMPIALNGVVLHAPIIQGPIGGGRLQISFGYRESAEQALAEAEAMVATLQAGARIESRWTVVRVDDGSE